MMTRARATRPSPARANVRAAAADAQPDAANYVDAKVRRWAYTSGGVTQPFQVTTSNIYVRDDNTLTHDFFYSANNQRQWHARCL